MCRRMREVRYGGIFLLWGIVVIFMIVGAQTVKAEYPSFATSHQPELKQRAEIVTKQWTVIQGKRLEFMLRYMGESADFEKDGIILKIPGNVARGWDIKEKQTVQVMIRKISDSACEIKIYKGTREIKEIPGSQLIFSVNEVFPYENMETLTVDDEDGAQLEAVRNKEEGLVVVKVEKTGKFYVKSYHTFEKQKPYVQVALIIAVGTAMGIGGKIRKWGGSHKEE